MAIVKKIAVALLVLVLSSIIFYIFVQDKRVKDDLLRVTLGTFGDQLLAMVPEGEEKVRLEKKYQDFLHSADQNKIPEEKIEKVAATILNLSNQDTPISAKDAMAVLDLNEIPEMPAPSKPDSQITEKHLQWPKDEQIRPTAWNTQEKNKLALRLSEMQQLDYQIDALPIHKPLKDKIIFSADSGLRVIIKSELKTVIDSCSSPKLESHIKNLEAQDMLLWEVDIPKNWINDISKYITDLPPDVAHSIPQNAKEIMKIFTAVDIDSLAQKHPDSLSKYLQVQFELNLKKKHTPN
jgi:hypothetical protein